MDYLYRLPEGSEEIRDFVRHVEVTEAGQVRVTLDLSSANFPANFKPNRLFARFYGTRGLSVVPATYVELPMERSEVTFQLPALAIRGEQPYFNFFVEDTASGRKVNHAIGPRAVRRVAGRVNIDEPTPGEGASYRVKAR